MKQRIVMGLFVVLSLFAFCPPNVAAQERPINLGKSLIRVANPGAMIMPGMPGMPHPGGGPFTYNSTVSGSFNPGVGSQGTLTLHYQFTGTTTEQAMCQTNATHTPKVQVTVFNNGTGKSVHYTAGTGVGACAQLNQTLALSFDLGSDQCSLDLLEVGTCTLTEEEDGMWCSQLDGFFATFLKHVQFEKAHTYNTSLDSPGPQYATVTNCSDTPPDWDGPSSEPIANAHWVSDADMFRWAPIGSSFTGIPWTFLDQRGTTRIQNGYPGICTIADQGIVGQ